MRWRRSAALARLGWRGRGRGDGAGGAAEFGGVVDGEPECLESVECRVAGRLVVHGALLRFGAQVGGDVLLDVGLCGPGEEID